MLTEDRMNEQMHPLLKKMMALLADYVGDNHVQPAQTAYTAVAAWVAVNLGVDHHDPASVVEFVKFMEYHRRVRHEQQKTCECLPCRRRRGEA